MSDETSTAVPATATVRPGTRLIALSALFTLAVACAGYWWTGSPAAIGAPPQRGHADGAEAQNLADFSGMVDKLAQRMQQEPSAEGLGMLGRSYLVLGRPDDAVSAYQRALKLQPDNATLLADLADATGVRNGRSLAGEPLALIERALKLEPDNLKALMLAGSEAYDRNAMPTALQYWQRMVDQGPPDHPLVQQAVAGVQELRSRAGMGAAAATAARGTAAASSGPAATVAAAATSGASALTGRISLSAELLAQVSPEDTVFIFARAAQGPRMPLAVLRKQVKDLPMEFRLDDTLALTPNQKLSTAASVVVGARISKSGSANAQPGEPEALSAPVKPDTAGVVLVIGAAPGPR